MLLLSACGFQLRGKIELSEQFERIYLQHQIKDPLYTALRQQLELNQLEIVSTPDRASIILQLHPMEVSRLAVAIRGKEVKENEVSIRATFQLVAISGKTIQRQSLLVRRRYGFDNAQVLGAANEEAILIEEMSQDLARQILRRLSRIQK